jgi:hypothetical protein
VEGLLSSVLQRRGNHQTFTIRRISMTERPDLVSKFKVEEPTLVVVEGRRIQRRIVPSDGRAIHRGLADWLK